MTTWTRMMIGEAVSDKAAGALLNIADAHLVEQLETYGATQARRLCQRRGIQKWP